MRPKPGRIASDPGYSAVVLTPLAMEARQRVNDVHERLLAGITDVGSVDNGTPVTRDGMGDWATGELLLSARRVILEEVANTAAVRSSRGILGARRPIDYNIGKLNDGAWVLGLPLTTAAADDILSKGLICNFYDEFWVDSEGLRALLDRCPSLLSIALEMDKGLDSDLVVMELGARGELVSRALGEHLPGAMLEWALLSGLQIPELLTMWATASAATDPWGWAMNFVEIVESSVREPEVPLEWLLAVRGLS